jgi:hypothetical protein
MTEFRVVWCRYPVALKILDIFCLGATNALELFYVGAANADDARKILRDYIKTQCRRFTIREVEEV